MTVHATQKYIRMSARKIRLVADLVRGQELAEIIAKYQAEFDSLPVEK